MTVKFFKDYEKYLPWFTIVLVLLYLLIMLMLSYWVDIRFSNIFGLNDWLIVTYEDDHPIFWVQMFKEASPTEYIQWFYLGISVLSSLAMFTLILKRNNKISRPWLFLSIGLAIMFAEDVFNLRHKLTGFVNIKYFNVTRQEWIYSPLRSYIEFLVYVLLAVIMVIALVYIFKDKRLSMLGKKLLIAGYFFYGVAAFASATRHLGGEHGWYVEVGRFVLLRLYPNNWIPLIEADPFYGLAFMDYLVEESIELLGAAFLLAALIVFITLIKKSSESVVEDSKPTLCIKLSSCLVLSNLLL